MEDTKLLDELALQDYKWGFVSDLDADQAPKGLNEEIIRFISLKKKEPQWMLEYRLKAFAHWQKMVEPTWPNVHYTKPDFQDIIYYSAPKPKKVLASLDELDPEIRATFDKLGISLDEQKRLSNVAVDAVIDSVSVRQHFAMSCRNKELFFVRLARQFANIPS